MYTCILNYHTVGLLWILTWQRCSGGLTIITKWISVCSWIYGRSSKSHKTSRSSVSHLQVGSVTAAEHVHVWWSELITCRCVFNKVSTCSGETEECSGCSLTPGGQPADPRPCGCLCAGLTRKSWFEDVRICQLLHTLSLYSVSRSRKKQNLLLVRTTCWYGVIFLPHSTAHNETLWEQENVFTHADDILKPLTLYNKCTCMFVRYLSQRSHKENRKHGRRESDVSPITTVNILQSQKRPDSSIKSWTQKINSVSAYLQPYSMFLFPLHVVDVPGDGRHSDDGVLHDLISRVALVKVLGKFLRRHKPL